MVPTYVECHVPSALRSHGTTNRLRLSPGTGMTTATSLRTSSHGTVRCTPLAGMTVVDGRPASWPSTSSTQTPVALTTTRARTAISRPSAVRTVAPAARPAGSLAIAVTAARVQTAAPWRAAVRARSTQSRASSAVAS